MKNRIKRANGIKRVNESKRINCVIFDLDGTLLDTSPGILECIVYASGKLGYPQLSRDQLLTFIGPPLKDSFMRCYGCTLTEALELTEAYREHYREGTLLHAKPYTGILELCRSLNEGGILVAVATSKPQVFAEQILTHFGFDSYISIIHGADMEGKLSKADLIGLCVKDVGKDTGSCAMVLDTELCNEGGDAASCVMVGDTEHDARGASLAGVPFIGVTYGFGDREKMLSYPNIGLAGSPMQVLTMIHQI